MTTKYNVISSLYVCIISTDEDTGLRIESFAVINLRGVSTNKTIIKYNVVRVH
jgi:hypothetical protein